VVVEVVEAHQRLLVALPQLLRRRRRRRKRRRRNPMMTWDSVSSTKRNSCATRTPTPIQTLLGISTTTLQDKHKVVWRSSACYRLGFYEKYGPMSIKDSPFCQ
jgi:hypothetical protein